jgi:hypothetical protein
MNRQRQNCSDTTQFVYDGELSLHAKDSFSNFTGNDVH